MNAATGSVDYLCNEWKGKPIGFLSYGAAAGGMRAARWRDTEATPGLFRGIDKGTRDGPANTRRDNKALMKMASHQGSSVGLIRNYCKRAPKTAELVALLGRLQEITDEGRKPTALPHDASLSPELVEAMIAEYKSGRSTYQIAASHQILRNTVRDVLRRNGFKFGAGKEARLTPEQKDKIRARRAAGEGPTALANTYGVSLPTIKRALTAE